MSGLTTHVLDLTSGRPAAKVATRLYARQGDAWIELCAVETDADGRARLLESDSPRGGLHRLEFDIGPYFRVAGAAALDPGFLETVAIEFNITGSSRHHHVPLLASPYGYSTYRGS